MEMAGVEPASKSFGVKNICERSRIEKKIQNLKPGKYSASLIDVVSRMRQSAHSAEHECITPLMRPITRQVRRCPISEDTENDLGIMRRPMPVVG
jgi:hypothetical protein